MVTHGCGTAQASLRPLDSQQQLLRVPFHPIAWQSGTGGLGGVFRGRFAGLDKSVGLHLDVISGNLLYYSRNTSYVCQLTEFDACEIMGGAQAEGS